jgi:hypothetical protein
MIVMQKGLDADADLCWRTQSCSTIPCSTLLTIRSGIRCCFGPIGLLHDATNRALPPATPYEVLGMDIASGAARISGLTVMLLDYAGGVEQPHAHTHMSRLKPQI